MIYWILLILLAVFASLEIVHTKKRTSAKRSVKIIILFIFATAMCLVCSLRYEVGRDWENYISYFNNCITYEGDFELGYRLLNKLFYYVAGDFYIMQFIVCGFCCVLTYRYIIKQSEYPLFSLFLYYTAFFLSLEMAQVRQFIALSIIICGMPYVKKKKIIQWTLIIILAMQFHITALIAFPLYFTTYKQIGWKMAFILCVIALFISFWGFSLIKESVNLISQIGLMPERLRSLSEIYLNSKIFGQRAEFGSGLGYLAQQGFIIIMLIVYVRSNQHNGSKENYFLLNCLIALIIDAAGRNLGELFRLAYYYYICGGGLCAYNLLVEGKNIVKRDARWIMNIVCLAFIALRLYSFISTGVDEAYTPYKISIFQ